MRGDIFLRHFHVTNRAPFKLESLTVTLDHKGFYNVMPHHLKVRVADPVVDGRLGPSEKIVEDSDFMS
jgi:hypothetical protein